MYRLLAGLRIVEAASFIAAPSCALHFAQMGADVVRIDQMGGGPDYRRWPLSPGGGASVYWEGLNKGKRSIAIGLTRPEGRDLALQLISAPGEGGGLCVTNFPIDSFLAYERMKMRRADMICLRVMGWPDGRTAVDYTVNAAVGIPMMTGPSGDQRPVNHVLPAWDLITGAYAAFSLLAAERARREGAGGQEIRLPLSDMAIACLGHLGQIAEVQLSGEDRPRMGNALFGATGRDFATADGRNLMLVAITSRQWSALVNVLGVADDVAALELTLSVDFGRDEGLRFQHRDRIEPLLERAIKQRGFSELTTAFDRAGVCWAPYQSLHEALRNEAAFTVANPLLVEVEHPDGKRYPTPGAAAGFSAEARSRPAPAPQLGAQTDEILADVPGLPDGEIGRLHDAKIVAGPEVSERTM